MNQTERARSGNDGRLLPFRRDDRPMPRLVDLDLEAQIIGAVMTDNALWRDCAFLEADHFNDGIHAILWAAIARLTLGSKPATAAAVAVELGEDLDKVGGRTFLSGLCSLGPAIAPAIGDAAERLRRLAGWRRLINLRDDIDARVRAQSASPDDALSATLRDVEAAIQSGRPTARTKREVAKSAVDEARLVREPVTTGLDSLDYLMHGGLMPRRLYGIGGLCGRGKTILMGSISDNVNLQGVKHLVISLETPPEDVELRNCAKHLDLNAAQIYDQQDPLHATFVKNADKYVANIPDNTIYEYRPGATMDEVQRLIIQNIHRHGIKGFILDYWQLVRGREKGQTEEQHLQEVADRLTAICRRENIWGVVFAQTDEHGKLTACPWGLKRSASLYIRLVREENDEVGYFMTEKSNYTRYADTGHAGAGAPSMVFSLQGPHFRNPTGEDVALIGRESEEPPIRL